MKIDEEELRKRNRLKQYAEYQNYLEEVAKEEKATKSGKKSGEKSGMITGKNIKKSESPDTSTSKLFEKTIKKSEKT